MVFRILGVPVYVSMAFWVTTLVLGLLGSRSGPLAIAWVVVTLVVVLVHELGHALVGRRFGGTPAIMLHGLGGTTTLRDVGLSRPQGAMVALAGPFAGFALGLVFVIALRLVPPGLPKEALRMGVVATFGYGLLNLLPVLPFDGWFVLREALGPKHERTSLVLSAVLGLAASLSMVRFSAQVGPLWPLPAGWFALSTVQSIRAAWGLRGRQEQAAAREVAASNELAAAVSALRADRWREAEARALVALAASEEVQVRDDARRVLITSALARDDGASAIAHLGALERPRDDDDVARAQALDLSGERDAAFTLLARRAAEHPDGPALAPLLAGLLATGQIERAASLAVSHARGASLDAMLAVLESLLDQGEKAAARRVAAALAERGDMLGSDPRVARLRARLAAE